MVIKILRESSEVLLDDEFAKKLRVAHLHREIPRQGDRAKQENPRQPKRFQDQPQFADRSRIEDDHHRGENQRDRPLRQRPQSDEAIKDRQMNFSPTLTPRPPPEHSNGKSRGQRHVHRSGAGIADNPSRGSGDECAIQFRSSPEAAKKEVHRQYEESGIDC